MVEELHRAYDLPVCAIFTLRSDVRLEIAAFRSEEWVAPGWTQSAYAGLVGRCIRERAPVMAGDVTAEPDYRQNNPALGHLLRARRAGSASGDEAWGAINWPRGPPNAFDSRTRGSSRRWPPSWAPALVSACAPATRSPPPRLRRVRRIVIVGSTGSIGTQALDVVERSPELEVVGPGRGHELGAAARAGRALRRAAASRSPTRTPPRAPPSAGPAARCWRAPRGSSSLIVEGDCDLVLNALVGSAGLGPTVAALGEGIDLALANKESLVVGGELVMALAEATGAQRSCRWTPSIRRCTS